MLVLSIELLLRYNREVRHLTLDMRIVYSQTFTLWTTMLIMFFFNAAQSLDFGTSERRSSGRRSGIVIRAVDCWQ